MCAGCDELCFCCHCLPRHVLLHTAGKIEFGVINQSSSAFNHILNDVSLVVYQVGEAGGDAGRAFGVPQQLAVCTGLLFLSDSSKALCTWC